MQSNEDNFGPDHLTTALSYWNLATVYIDLKNYSAAKELLEKAFTVFTNQLGENHPHTKGVKSWLDIFRNSHF